MMRPALHNFDNMAQAPHFLYLPPFCILLSNESVAKAKANNAARKKGTKETSMTGKHSAKCDPEKLPLKTRRVIEGENRRGRNANAILHDSLLLFPSKARFDKVSADSARSLIDT